MSKYQVIVLFQELDEVDNVLVNRAYKTPIVNAAIEGQALALLHPEVEKAWRTLKQSILTDTVEIPDITNNIETK